MKVFKELFKAGKIGSLKIRNRIMMAPMETHYSNEKGKISNQHRAYYEARARGGVGLIILEAMSVEYPRGNTVLGNLALDDDAQIPGLSELTRAIKKQGAGVAAQIFHAGAEAHRRITGVEPVGASVVRTFRGDTPKELTTDEIANLVGRFAEAAKRAKKAGCDAVEIHGATYYLLDQFISRHWNKRNDRYGGPLENRARFLLETIEAVRKAVGKEFTVWCRINGTEFGLEDGITLEEAKQVARWAEAAGADAIHVSSFGAGKQPHMGPTVVDHNILLPLAREIKKGLTVPMIAVGRIEPDEAEKALAEGWTDFIAIGRGLIADPDFCNKLAEGRPEDVRTCICCLECINHIIYKGVPLRCSVNALCGMEEEIKGSPTPKKVIVIGGGPGGMEAARVAALLGHRVTLYEKDSQLGGLLRSAALPPQKEDLAEFLAYLKTQLTKLGVKVHPGEELTPAKVQALKPDAVVVACGASPFIPNIEGLDQVKPITAEKALLGTAEVGSRVLIIGGGLVGLETADYLLDKGKSVTIVDILEKLAPDMVPLLRRPLMDRLRKKGAKIFPGIRKERFEGKRFIFQDQAGTEQVVEADTIILATGGRPKREEWAVLESKIAQVHFVGDLSDPQGGILEAMADGSRVGRAL